MEQVTPRLEEQATNTTDDCADARRTIAIRVRLV
jgi:hypothetical protein